MSDGQRGRENMTAINLKALIQQSRADGRVTPIESCDSLSVISMSAQLLPADREAA